FPRRGIQPEGGSPPAMMRLPSAPCSLGMPDSHQTTPLGTRVKWRPSWPLFVFALQAHKVPALRRKELSRLTRRDSSLNAAGREPLSTHLGRSWTAVVWTLKPCSSP